MNGKDLMNCIMEEQEWDARRSAQLEKIYLDEKEKLNSNNNIFEYGTCNSPFIHISNEPSIGAVNNITLSDSQFKEFIDIIKRHLK